MVVEAAAASIYWAVWSQMPVQWVRRDLPRVPDGWQVVGPRTSPLTGSPRRAITPVHAALGYLYGVAEGEAVLALRVAGLDPSEPALHAPMRARNSLALDCLEAIRGDIDAGVHHLVQTSVFRFDDFAQLRDGNVRVVPPLSHNLAETAPMWRRLLGPMVEAVAAKVAQSPGIRIDRLPTHLTEANRSAGRSSQRRKPSRQAPTPRSLSAATICRGCGTEIAADLRWCDSCRPEAKLQAGRDGLAAARTPRAKLHQDGLDPATSPESRAKQRDARLRRRAEEGRLG